MKISLKPLSKNWGPLLLRMALTSDVVLLVDAGGVLFNNVIEDSSFLHDVASHFGVNLDLFRRQYKAHEEQFETNQVSVHEALTRSLNMLGVPKIGKRELDKIDRLYVTSVVANQQIFILLPSLRSIGVKLVLANNEAEHWDELKHEAFYHLNLFDNIASSWKLKSLKPSAEYFGRLEAMLHPVPKSQWRLLDDNANNVVAARRAGIAAVRYIKGAFSLDSTVALG